MAHVVRRLELQRNCKGCNTTTDLYTINCGHMTLCFSCAKVLFLTVALCSQCSVSVEQLIEEYTVTAHKQQLEPGVQQATRYMLYMKGFQFLSSPAPNWYPFHIKVPGLKKPPTLQEAQNHLKRLRPHPMATATATTPTPQVPCCKKCGTKKALHSTTCHHLTLCFECANVMFLAGTPCPHCLVPIKQLVDEWEDKEGRKKVQYYTLVEGGYCLEYPDDLAIIPSPEYSDDLAIIPSPEYSDDLAIISSPEYSDDLAIIPSPEYSNDVAIIPNDASKDEPESSNMKSKPQAMVLAQKVEQATPLKKVAVKRSAPNSTKAKGDVKRGVPVAISKPTGVVNTSRIPLGVSKDKVVSVERAPMKAKEVAKSSVSVATSKRALDVNQVFDLEAERKATLLACGLSESP